MTRKASRAEAISALAHPEDRRDAARRARAEVRFDEQAMLGALFGEFDANLVQIENRLGVLIAARGNKVIIEGHEDEVARAREVLVERKGKKPGQWLGKSPWLQSVHFEGDAEIGAMVTVELAEAGANSLRGRLLETVAA